MSRMPPLHETPSQSLRRKLPYYLIGLAIGCFVVGIMIMLRQMATPPAPPAGQPGGGAPASTSPTPR